MFRKRLNKLGLVLAAGLISAVVATSCVVYPGVGGICIPCALGWGPIVVDEDEYEDILDEYEDLWDD